MSIIWFCIDHFNIWIISGGNQSGHSGESMVCNNPESTYQLMIETAESSSNSAPSPTSASTKSKSSDKSSNNADDNEQSCSEVFNTLDPSTISKSATIKTIIVSQTWLTGWIRELYQIEDNIVKSTGKTIQ